MKKFLLRLILVVIIVTGSAVGWVSYNIFYKETLYNQKITIEQGENLYNVFKKLDQHENNYLKLYLKFNDAGKDIKAGYYYIQGYKTIVELVDVLKEGRTELEKFTIYEGDTYEAVLERLEKKGYGSVEDYEKILENITFPYPTPNGNFEGYFYPDTYYLSKGQDPKSVLKMMLGEFLRRFPPKDYPDKDEFYKELILASIIEREALLSSEKPTISSVFKNRIKIGMKLQSDATVNYVFGYKKRRIFYRDLRVDSPYNTYRYKGLPPGPIGNPDEKSIKAAINPIESNYLFFVAVEDGSGRHKFSATYGEHTGFIKAVRDRNRNK